MDYDFFAYLSRMKYIKRWALMRSTNEENIMEHSLQVTEIAHAIALIKNEVFGGSVDPYKVMCLAVTVNASSHLTAQDGWRDAHGETVDNTVRLINGEEILPKTGDVSAVVFVIAGSILIGAICALILEILFRAAKRRIRR